MRGFVLRAAVITAVFALPAMAEAQRGGGYGGRGFGAYGYGDHGFGGRGYGYGGYGFGAFGLYGFGYGYPYFGYGGYYDVPYYSAVPPSGAYPVPPANSTPPVPPAMTLANNQAQVQVILPDPKAALFFDGRKTVSLGSVRLFDPPKLEPGVQHSYKLTASWMQGGQPVTDARIVSVIGGQVTVVDFTRPASAEPVPPPTLMKN